ncbi:hypothetical protein PC114_g16347 [Phytophthora cactorum]|uniref:Uncharacterized protein n=1 Tax=Phytophthora cactorum TaxID=29920 RepID=A0A8T1CKL2_9STRA|nr:hypothetical protein PC112_g16590 [Phytophthora cactorum]KAG2893158.1 hypothetical protein PC114_g16347 [Phytophthora cactorum]KAG2923490.1 hypothetical protein PC117_g15720 [Phytophthora cactorum]
MECLPFSFVERKLARLNASLSFISEETGVHYLVIVAAKAEARLACALPDNFGLTATASSSDAYYSDLDCTSRAFVLLAFCSLDNEEDLSAQNLFGLIADTLTRYSKPWDAIVVMVGDNCAANQLISNKIGGIPCSSYYSRRDSLGAASP